MDSYFTMLFNLQSEKVNKIILCPGINQVEDKLKCYGVSIRFLEYLCRGICLDTRMNKKKREREPYISLNIKDRYLVSMVSLTCKLNNYSFDEGIELTNKLAAKLMKCIPENIRIKSNIEFAECLKYVTVDEFLDGIRWFEYQVEFAISIKDKYNDSAINKKKKVSSILEEL